jgi:hypothetical protein
MLFRILVSFPPEVPSAREYSANAEMNPQVWCEDNDKTWYIGLAEG